MLVVGRTVNHFAGQRAQEGLVEMLTGYAPTCAAEMKVDGHESLSAATRPDDPAYLRMIEAEKRCWPPTPP